MTRLFKIYFWFTFIMIFIGGCHTATVQNEKASGHIQAIQDTTVFIPHLYFRDGEIKIYDLFETWADYRESYAMVIWRPLHYKKHLSHQAGNKISFDHDGSYKEMPIDSTDVNYTGTLRWRLSKNDHKRIVIFDEEGKEVKSLYIEILKDRILVFRNSKN